MGTMTSEQTDTETGTETCCRGMCIRSECLCGPDLHEAEAEAIPDPIPPDDETGEEDPALARVRAVQEIICAMRGHEPGCEDAITPAEWSEEEFMAVRAILFPVQVAREEAAAAEQTEDGQTEDGST